MNYFRISKYDPKKNYGDYSKVWTSIHNVDQVFKGQKLTMEIYEEVSKRYIDCIIELAQLAKVEKFKISNLIYDYFDHWKDDEELELEKIGQFIQECLDDESDGRLLGDQFIWNCGYDFNMDIGTVLDMDQVQQVASKYHLFVKKRGPILNYFCVSKYDPAVDNSRNLIDFSIVDKVYHHQILTMEEYKKIEKRYIDFVIDVVQFSKIEKPQILYLEHADCTHWKNGQELDLGQIEKFVLESLENKCWGRLMNDQLIWEAGYDFYMKMGTLLNMDQMQHIADKYNLFVEYFPEIELLEEKKGIFNRIGDMWRRLFKK